MLHDSPRITEEVHVEKARPWAVVTGASSGIGYELAKVFANNGFDLLIVAEDEGIVEAAQGIGRFGTSVEFLRADLATYNGVEQLYRKIEQAPVEVDSLCINAGVGVGGASFDKTDLEEELRLIDLNIKSVVHLTKRVLPRMLQAGHGRILFTSSIAAMMPGPYESVYAASRAFVQSFCEAIRQEVNDKGVTITALQPGPTETNFFHRAGMDDTKVGQKSKDDPEMVAQAGFDALMRGDNAVVTGLSNKVQAGVAKVVPQTVAAKLHGQQTKPNSPLDR